jgi:flagellar hook-basal body complex protein FliE
MTAAAQAALGELQETLSLATDKAENALAVTALATGGDQCQSEAGQNAYSFAAMLNEKIQDVYRVAEQAVAELERYDGGF